MLLARSHQAEIIIVKRLIQGRNNVTRVEVELRSYNRGRRKNDAFTHSATLPSYVIRICNEMVVAMKMKVQQITKFHLVFALC